MSAVSEFPKHTNPQALQAGLVLQSKPEVDCNEYGMEQGTLRFLTLNKNLRKLAPKRATPASEFVAGDDLTARILKHDFDYLGAQTTRKIRNGSKPGIGILEVLCQGAIFVGHSGDIPGVITPASADDPITTPNNPSDSTIDTVTIPVFSVESDTGVSTGQIVAVINYHAIDLHFEYMARDRAQRPRFLRNSYDKNPETEFLIIDEDGTELELMLDSVVIQKTGAITPTSDPREVWKTMITYAGTGARFSQIPAGQFWHVTETATIKIVPTSDWQNPNAATES